MASIGPALDTSKPRTWTRDGFVISTDPSLIPIPALNKAFASEEIYWASALPASAMRDMLQNSLSFGLYSPTPSPPPPTDQPNISTTDPAETWHEIAASVQKKPDSRPLAAEPSLIGFARAITDRVTFLYLTDVYVLPEWQGRGLGNWLVGCVQEVVEDMPYLRRSMCIIGHGRQSRMEFYKRLMKMEPLADPAMVLNWKGPGCMF